MAYNGSVELISGIKQKNNGTFPLVDASAVRVTDNKNLDTELGNFVRTDGTQTLTDEKKVTARENIDAASTQDVSELKSAIGEITPMFASKNLIDTSKLTSGKYVDYNSGNLYTNANYSATDFIEVEPDTPYTFSLPSDQNVQQMAYYGASKNYIEGFSGLGEYGEYTFTTPSNCRYVRWTIINANIQYVQLEKGPQKTTYKPYNLELEGKHANADELAEAIKGVAAFAPIESKNLIDLSVCTVGKYVDSSNGGIGTNANYSVTDFIPVVPNGTYTFSIYGFSDQLVERYAIYDENKSYVSGSLNSGVRGSCTFTIPSDGRYIRWSLLNNYKAYSQLEKGSVATEYENYRKYINAKYLPKIVKTVGASGCDYTSLLEALKSTDATVELHLKKGIYDIVAEYEDYYGASFWSDYAGYSGAGATDPFNKGLWLEKGRRIIGEAGAVISFPYTGNNDNVKEKFSIFANDTDVLLENLTITANSQCCRYAIHDDFQPNGGVIEFRKLLFDMTPNKHAVIGAGLGIDTTYIIDNCVFENNSKSFDIHYHGNTVANQDTHCKFFITNCYGSKYCYFGYYGDSTEVSDAIVNNCAFQNIECSAYSGATFANIRLIQWNNTRV